MRNSGRLLLFPGGLCWCINQHSCLHPIECHRNTANEERPLQHFCDFHRKPTPIDQNPSAWHKWANAQPNVSPCKSSNTPNKLRTKMSHRVCHTDILPCTTPPPPGNKPTPWPRAILPPPPLVCVLGRCHGFEAAGQTIPTTNSGTAKKTICCSGVSQRRKSRIVSGRNAATSSRSRQYSATGKGRCVTRHTEASHARVAHDLRGHCNGLG